MATLTETIKKFDQALQDDTISQASYIKQTLLKEQQLDDIEPRTSIHLSLPGNVHLKENQQKLIDQDIAILVKVLNGNTLINSIDLRYNRITDKGAISLAQAIKDTKSLKHINLNGNDITEEGGKMLALSLQENDTVQEFRIRSNKIGNSGGMAFAQMLQVNTTLEKLDLSDTDLRTEAVIALATVLRNNRTIKFLLVNRPLLFTNQEEPTVHFAKMLKINSSLRGLGMMKFDMRDFGIGQIAENILDNMTITHLDFSCNRITRDGMEMLSKVLLRNTCITHLDLSNNRLECPGARFLAVALKHSNTNLKSVSVRFNNIKGKGLCELADALKLNTTLTELFIWGNVLEESACIAFKSLIDANRLVEGCTDVKPYVVDEVTYLCEMNVSPHSFDYWKPVYGDNVPSQLV